jgi:signal peptidase I
MNPQNNQDSKSPSASNRNHLWIEGFKTIGLSLIFAFGIRTMVADSRYVSSGSMLPTLEVNDRLMVDKLSYHWSNPQRGDIVVFAPTETLKRQHFKDSFIKRLIGLPGEKVEIKAGRVYVNNKLLSEKYVDEKLAYQWGPVTVPPNSYLMMGDNRDNSYDGRYWGFVPRENIIGKAVVRYWSPDRHLGTIDPAPIYPTSPQN